MLQLLTELFFTPPLFSSFALLVYKCRLLYSPLGLEKDSRFNIGSFLSFPKISSSTFSIIL